ncbi:MAG: sporulation transcriptional regulator SpoIIID [Acetatifactor sp.]|nr:sporulation transcriptional regulator SpoIIID [Acetatifactor sp.]
MKDYIEERSINIANYIINCNAPVRQTAKAFGVSKSVVPYIKGTKWKGLGGWWSKKGIYEF